MKQIILLIAFFVFVIITSCNRTDQTSDGKLSFPFEKYTLANGMDVIFHLDKSDPIVAVAIQYHVGSNREVPGKTGFAHLFEHMMFQQSENVGQDQFFRKIQGAGGTLNGGTSNDATTYFEVVPKNALEMVLWLESDRLGFLENTVTRSAFANQQNVVQNEKRQGVDNQPYGHNEYVILKNLYPKGHPYNWDVIGEMEDLFNATTEDVKAFHRKFYVPNNSTLVIAGDFNPDEVKPLVEKYFGEIPGGEKITDMKPIPVALSEPKKLYHEDNFARTPLFTMVWPTVEQFTPDAYALDFLAQILGNGKKSPMYKVLVKEKKLTPRVSVYNSSQEIAGTFRISVNANAGISLKDVETAISEAFTRFEKEGIAQTEMEKNKAGLETSFYNNISSILGKSFSLANYNEYAGDPGFIEKDIENIKSVTIDDVLRVYNKYIKGKPYIATSFVPKGQLGLVADNSVKADVVEENIENATKVDQSAVSDEGSIVKTPSKFDRSVEPQMGPNPELTIPKVWNASTSNGIKVFGIQQSEVPLIQWSMVIDGGHLLDSPEKPGVAGFLASMMTEGTKNKTPEDLEEAIDLLGAGIYVNGGTENISISVNTFSRNYEKTMDLVKEILLEPRWDEEQFGLIKSRIINNLKRNAAEPNYLASVNFSKLVYGENSILGVPSSGTISSVEAITMDDLKDYYNRNISPSVACIQVAGSLSQERIMKGLQDLTDNWASKQVSLPEMKLPAIPDKGGIYFVDVPGAKQSVINVGYAGLKRTDPDYFAATVMNYKLGGSFNGYLNLILREEKGFTYGARSGFSGGKNYGVFSASSSVRSDATLESVGIFKGEMEKYVQSVSDEDLIFTRDALLKSYVRQFETLGSLLGMLSNISNYKLPVDYIKNEESFIKGLTSEQHTALAKKYIDPSKMYYVVVGDAKTQLKPLESVGLGAPILLNQ